MPSPPERKHLMRLEHVWLANPIYFVTLCVNERRCILHSQECAQILMENLERSSHIHGWSVGRYVIMPDHVHFFCSQIEDRKTLSEFLRDFKRFTSRQMIEAGIPSPIWQSEFFDHLIRSRESYDSKWEYVRENPIRAGLVRDADEWRYQGELERLIA